MNKRYKIIISNDNLYKEIELSREAKLIKIGTTIDCDVRLRKWGTIWVTRKLLKLKLKGW